MGITNKSPLAFPEYPMGKIINLAEGSRIAWMLAHHVFHLRRGVGYYTRALQTYAHLCRAVGDSRGYCRSTCAGGGSCAAAARYRSLAAAVHARSTCRALRAIFANSTGMSGVERASEMQPPLCKIQIATWQAHVSAHDFDEIWHLKPWLFLWKH